MNNYSTLKYLSIGFGIIFMVVAPFTIHAEIHKCVNNGHITFSDKPCLQLKTQSRDNKKSPSKKQTKGSITATPLKPVESVKGTSKNTNLTGPLL